MLVTCKPCKENVCTMKNLHQSIRDNEQVWHTGYNCYSSEDSYLIISRDMDKTMSELEGKTQTNSRVDMDTLPNKVREQIFERNDIIRRKKNLVRNHGMIICYSSSIRLS